MGKGGLDLGTVAFLLAIMVVFYLLILRPSRKRERDRRQMLDNLKKGNSIVTIGGIRAVVVSVRDSDVVIKVDTERNVHLIVLKSAIGRVAEEEATQEEPKDK